MGARCLRPKKTRAVPFIKVRTWHRMIRELQKIIIRHKIAKKEKKKKKEKTSGKKMNERVEVETKR